MKNVVRLWCDIIMNPRVDKVSMFIHTRPHKSPRNIKVTMCNHQADRPLISSSSERWRLYDANSRGIYQTIIRIMTFQNIAKIWWYFTRRKVYEPLSKWDPWKRNQRINVSFSLLCICDKASYCNKLTVYKAQGNKALSFQWSYTMLYQILLWCASEQWTTIDNNR